MGTFKPIRKSSLYLSLLLLSALCQSCLMPRYEVQVDVKSPDEFFSKFSQDRNYAPDFFDYMVNVYDYHGDSLRLLSPVITDTAVVGEADAYKAKVDTVLYSKKIKIYTGLYSIKDSSVLKQDGRGVIKRNQIQTVEIEKTKDRIGFVLLYFIPIILIVGILTAPAFTITSGLTF